ncbi:MULTISPECIES: 2Fe-2S iron-sulfur cluster-binding protein [Desulfobacula]|uniref:2Fe-2S and 4Fe-4S ferredoxin iron-sulfur protein n=2 Tax=Desulfobacula TaxID=28222 RepID=K0NFS4_DESTT|nr:MULTISPECIES: 2Fe-2S iron-sulfur cluster-binding protein [Desulfobacula]CCK78563.1 2Fe-2S and 4Fe-4S ferredoxin iron-sulfur protein [Desulfobacula toluolica Tol2]SDT89865.1 4Fe-4S dicluster domain-containing protein [Desulfobacula phenolica]
MTDKSSMIAITIDGKKILAKKNQTILQAAKENQIQIPHLCYHPALKPSGSCKLCGVEVKSPSGRQVVMLSCILKVKENLSVKTESQLVKTHRKKAFNALLQMAPDSARIRELAQAFEVAVSPPPDGCIRCRLCIRVCNEIVKARALKMVKTQNGNRVMPEAGRCIGCGTCANLCPTNTIKVTDRDNVRTVSIKGETIGRLPLERCEGCGNRYATTRFLRHVEESTLDHPDTKEHHHLCPSCIKLMSNRAVTERERIKK